MKIKAFSKIAAVGATALMVFTGAGVASAHTAPAALPTSFAASVPLASSSNLAQPAAKDLSGISLTTSSQAEIEAALRELTFPTGGAIPYYFDEQKARELGASADLLRVGGQFNEYVSSQYDKRSRLKVWGNWCGPKWGGGTPVDTLDEACMHHDKCYERQGYFSCDCDQQLIDEINDKFALMKSDEKAAAVAVKAYFTLQKMWCKYYALPLQSPHQLVLHQWGWYVARYEISWDQLIDGKWQRVQWKHNHKDRTLRNIDFIDLPATARNLHVKALAYTGLVWNPWRVIVDNDFTLNARVLNVDFHGTTFRPFFKTSTED